MPSRSVSFLRGLQCLRASVRFERPSPSRSDFEARLAAGAARTATRPARAMEPPRRAVKEGLTDNKVTRVSAIVATLLKGRRGREPDRLWLPAVVQQAGRAAAAELLVGL